MNCPVCGEKTIVVDCASDCEAVYRRRRCVECSHKFITTELESEDKHIFSVLRWNERKKKMKKG